MEIHEIVTLSSLDKSFLRKNLRSDWYPLASKDSSAWKKRKFFYLLHQLVESTACELRPSGCRGVPEYPFIPQGHGCGSKPYFKCRWFSAQRKVSLF
jgi:hypothetical protein